MATVLKLQFAPLTTAAKGVLVLFCEEGLKFGPAARNLLAGNYHRFGRGWKGLAVDLFL